MSQVRVSTAAEEILAYCRPWHERKGTTCFDSYAEMVIFSAGLGFSKAGRRRPKSAVDFLSQPNPISVDVFKSQQLYPIMLLLALAVTKDNQIAKDEKRICAILEDFAEIGFRELKKVLDQSNPQEFHIELGRLVAESKTPKI